jgi:ABC-type amino acid transport substrate-binding protein
MKSTLTLIIILIINSFVSAQNTLNGFIAEKNGKLLMGAKISIKSDQFNTTIYSGVNGWFNINIPDGNYSLNVLRKGYENSKSINIDLNSNKIIFQKIELTKIINKSSLDKDTFRIGMVYDSPLYWKDTEGKTWGLCYELAEVMKIKLNKTFVYENIDYITGPEKLKKGKLDLLFGGFIPDSIYGSILWSRGFIEADYRLIIPIGSSINHSNLKNYNNLVIGHFNEPVIPKWIDKYFVDIKGNKLNITKKSLGTSDADWFTCLIDNDVDIIINEYPYAVWSMLLHLEELEMDNISLNKQQYSIGVKSGDLKLLNRIDDELYTIINSKIYKAIYKKYLGKNFDLDISQKYPFDLKEMVVTEEQTSRIYITQKDDTMESVAQRYLGDKSRANDIYYLNKGNTIIEGLKSVDKLPISYKLKLPCN